MALWPENCPQKGEAEYEKWGLVQKLAVKEARSRARSLNTAECYFSWVESLDKVG